MFIRGDYELDEFIRLFLVVDDVTYCSYLFIYLFVNLNKILRIGNILNILMVLCLCYHLNKLCHPFSQTFM